MIGGSNAAGEAIPSNFQFLTHAQVNDNMRLCNKIIEFITKIVKNFGFGEEREVRLTLIWNEPKGLNG